MGAAMGKVPKLGLRMGTLMRTHRRVGRVGLALAGVVAFLCWRAGGGAPTAEGIVHGALASTGFLAIAIEVRPAQVAARARVPRRPVARGLCGGGVHPRRDRSATPGDDLFELDDDAFEPDGGGSDGGGGDGAATTTEARRRASQRS